MQPDHVYCRGVQLSASAAQKWDSSLEVATMSKAVKKYLDADEYNGAKNEGTAKAPGFVTMLKSALQTEYETVEKMVKKDRDQSKADRAGEHNAADARFTGEKKRVDDLVAALLAVMQAAMTVISSIPPCPLLFCPPPIFLKCSETPVTPYSLLPVLQLTSHYDAYSYKYLMQRVYVYNFVHSPCF